MLILKRTFTNLKKEFLKVKEELTAKVVLLAEKDSEIKMLKEELSKVKESNIELNNYYNFSLDEEKKLSKNLDIAQSHLKDLVLSKISSMEDESIYNLYSEVKHLDEDSLIEYKIVDSKLNVNLYEQFPYEDNLGYFEGDDCSICISYSENAVFGQFNCTETCGTYEIGTYTKDYKATARFISYRNEVIKEFIFKLAESKPVEFYSYIKAMN